MQNWKNIMWVVHLEVLYQAWREDSGLVDTASSRGAFIVTQNMNQKREILENPEMRSYTTYSNAALWAEMFRITASMLKEGDTLDSVLSMSQELLENTTAFRVMEVFVDRYNGNAQKIQASLTELIHAMPVPLLVALPQMPVASQYELFITYLDSYDRYITKDDAVPAGSVWGKVSTSLN